jgi:GT2 family glycosyltransferase/glycosyltransferase involved in cell wall biosynthesis
MGAPRRRRSSFLLRFRGGLLSNLPKRAWLTLRYQGLGTLVFRLVTFPLRLTPLGDRLRHDWAHTSEHRTAHRWYQRKGRPVTIVIPTYGDPSMTLDAVRSVRATVELRRTRIIVTDDGSAPEHQARLRAELRGLAEVILGEQQAGFAVNANRGLRGATGDVVLLNNDVIAHKGWLERLQYFAYSARQHGIVGPKLLYPDHQIQSAGSYRNLGAQQWFDHRYRFASAEHGPAEVPAAAIGMTGACLYVKRAVIDDIGLLDEGYAMAYEDMDWCLRAWEAGWEVAYYPRASLTHHESVSRGMVAGEREVASQQRFWTRWGDWFDRREVRTPDGRLRVIYVTEDTGVGGGHRDIFEHLNRLQERGHDVALYTLGDDVDWFDLRAPMRSFEDYGELIDALAVEDAIKVATWWGTAAPVWLASVRKGIPVFFVQDIETSYYPESEAMRSAVLASYREEFRYMTISGWNRDRLRELRLDADLVPPGIDLETFRPLRGVTRRDDMLLALGRTNPLKNLPLTIDAWRALDTDRPELCLFGIEPELGPTYGACYVERPSDEGVNELLNAATIFVQTSTHEGFCLPPLEAMATGGAVVCTDAHGNRDFCRDGVNCLIPDPTVESVTGAIARLLADPDMRRRLGEEGIRTAQGFSWERRIDELERFLERVAEQRRPSGQEPVAAPTQPT